MADAGCIFINSHGVRCPRMVPGVIEVDFVDGKAKIKTFKPDAHVKAMVCVHHQCRICGQLTVKLGFCAVHSEEDLSKKNPIEESWYTQCKYVSKSGQTCEHKVKDDGCYCTQHRCPHGKNTFRHAFHCTNSIVEGQKYCEEHMDSCDCYWDEDECGGGVCSEDIDQCSRSYIVDQPHRMCEFHYNLYLFNLGETAFPKNPIL